MQRQAGNAAVTRLLLEASARRLPVQRVIRFQNETVEKKLNLADSLIPGGVFGNTFMKLNGVENPPNSMRAAIARPNLNVVPQNGGGAHVSVASDPPNTISWRLELPTENPWTKQVDRNEIGPRVEGQMDPSLVGNFQELINTYRGSSGKVQLEAQGAPTNQEFRELVRAHEERHVDHIREAVGQSIVPWDSNLRRYAPPQTPFTASSPAAAHQEFFAAVGDPDAVADQMGNHFRAQGDAFHGTPQGGSPDIDKFWEEGSLFRKRPFFRWRHPHQ